MTMNQEQYEKLITTDTFDQLVNYSKKFDLYTVMGVISLKGSFYVFRKSS